MTDSLWPILMLVVLLVGIFSGYSVAFVLAGTGVLFAFVADLPTVFLSMGVSRIYSGTLTNWLLIAIPLFVYMGLMLERSGVAERLLTSLARLLGPMPGGYAFSVIVIGIVMAASTGIIGASVVLLGLLALPMMKEAGYSRQTSSGLVAATGTLGILIPPSIMLIILGDTLRISVGHLFIGAVFPGLILGGLYIAYIAALALFRPGMMPPLPKSDKLGFAKTIILLLQDLVAPLVLVVAVLGSIVVGIATPTEAAGIGAIGATILALAAMRGRLHEFGEVLRATTKTTVMIIFVMLGATIFSLVFKRLGGESLILGAFLGLDVEPFTVIIMIMLLIFILGLFLEWVEITLIVLPLFAPIIIALDFGIPQEEAMLWFALLFALNLQTSFLTPPFGYALFYLRGIAPDGYTIGDIYRGVLPFVLLQLTALLLLLFFPGLATWLPQTLMGAG
ncbi:TRAP transporter large permease subunit [Halomonas sp. MCCC 1A11036]|uniref:TRAP transporter large permease protein n=1 Tax=Billgrantia zhangzhouensis TaxID=2733481 RepID=A0ABS9AFN9_9GAMM|nr:TRAP transporter large permease subunit [Halomonas zhangzhouensis]